MKTFGKILLGTLAFISLLLVLVFSILLFVWLKPEVIVTESNIKKALTYAPKNLKTSWSSLAVRFEPLGFTGKTVDIKSQDLCFSWEPLVSSCLPEVNIRISFLVNHFYPRLTQIEQFVVHGDFLKLNLPEKAKKKNSSALPDLRLPSFAAIFPAQLDLQKLGLIAVSIKDITVLQKDSEPIKARAELSRLDQDPDKIAFDIDAELLSAKIETLHLHSQVQIFGHEKLEAQAKITAKTKDLSAVIPLTASWGSELVLIAQPVIKTRNLDITTPVRVDWNKEQLKLVAGPYETTKLWAKGKIGLKDCLLISHLNKSAGYPENNDLQCSVLVWPKAKIKGLSVIETTLKADVKLNSPDNENIQVLANVFLTGENAFVVARAESHGDLYFDTAKKEILEKSSGNFKLSLKIPDFNVWKEVFEQTLFAIPAPLHVLKGSIELNAEAQLPKWQDELSGKAELKTDLAEKKQKLLTTTIADFTLLGNILKPTGIDVSINADIKDVRLEAPPLRLETPPQFLPDKRFILKQKAKLASKNNFSVIWKLKAKTASPLQISSNLLPEPVPIALDISTGSNQKMEGKVVIQSFPFEVFRKKARVDNVTLTYYRNAPSAELSGRVLYSNPEVDIRILLLGTTNQPRIEFESDPPLNRQQIISVLLFNKSIDELTEEEVNSTASMSRALSDGAFGLFSLFFLSSTPIQSISYDPVEQAYTARVKLDNNTTLSLGSDFSAGRQFTVRRRLGGPWSVRTELRQEENRPDVVLTLLEWLQRF